MNGLRLLVDVLGALCLVSMLFFLLVMALSWLRHLLETRHHRQTHVELVEIKRRHPTQPATKHRHVHVIHSNGQRGGQAR